MAGATGGYDKRLADLRGVYRDSGAYVSALAAHGERALAYRVEEYRAPSTAAGDLVVGTTRMLPWRIGEEFAVTRGHLHAIADRAEFYQCLSGTGVMLLETLDGESHAVPLSAGQSVYVPGHWIHRSVNVGDAPFVVLFCYPADAGQDYTIIERAQGMAQLVVSDGAGGWALRPNPDHIGYRTKDA